MAKRSLPSIRRLRPAGFLLGVLAASLAHAGELPERCYLAPQNGQCKALIERYYFDSGRNRCVEYFYDGCGPVVPFEEREECQAMCEVGEVPRLARIERIADLPYIAVTIDYPKAWQSPTLRVFTDGREVPVTSVGGGHDQNSQQQTLRVAPGERCRELAITVQHAGETHRLTTPFSCYGPSLVLPLGHLGFGEVIGRDTRLQFAVQRLADATFLLNGNPVPTEPVPETAHGVELIQLTPVWREGLNTLEVEATTEEGQPLSRVWTFVLAPDGTVPLGQQLRIRYGHPGSKSGPFYRLELAGDAVAITGQLEVAVVQRVEGWLMPSQVLVADLKAEKPGDATLSVFVKPHFLSPIERDREYRFHVVAPQGAPAR